MRNKINDVTNTFGNKFCFIIIGSPIALSKSKYMGILVRHWGKDGKGTAAKEQFPIVYYNPIEIEN